MKYKPIPKTDGIDDLVIIPPGTFVDVFNSYRRSEITLDEYARLQQEAILEEGEDG